ncbi:MAG: DNA-3-methyladenine glycosylase 2 [Candidatus Binatus sp.]|nr:DNA-3-methyladenine glycosylase 2 [Candidatus Binatus sp.]
MLEPDTCYRAAKAHDPRFDGRFFIGVSSTGIYCRPICTVKMPKRENCTFFPSAAAAESEGYRPCLRCRPELAPGNASVDSSHRIAQAAASLIEDGTLSENSLDTLAARLGVTDRHLRRVFQGEFGVCPVAFAQTQRLLLAKRLLTDTDSALTDIAFASGFGSLRRFNALFKDRYRLSPKQLRKTPRPAAAPDTLTFELSFRPPYDWASMLAFLRARCVTGVEEVGDASYRRIVRIAHGGEQHVGWLEVAMSPKKPALRILISASLMKVLPAVLARIKHLMDLSANPSEIAETLGDLAARNPGLRVPGAFDGFEIAVRAILGQQITVAAARTLASRFAKAFGCPVESPFPALSIAFPSPERIAQLSLNDVASLGVIASRARAIIQMAGLITERDLSLTPGVNVDSTLQKLRSIPGVGEWTVQYLAMRTLAWPDAFLHTDLIVMRALAEKNPRRVLARSEAWRPWRAYAVMHLWAAEKSRRAKLETANGTVY